ncbi:hypothetical protein ACFWBH_24865 [Streptomyces sp. NPDC059999]|uniref:hypothetical protein n=1 Tax=Streptomyces sp. NPDC059999 TaxID=3347030 RepID=UPI00369EE0D4
MESNTNQNTAARRPESLSQRWAIVLTRGFIAGAVVFILGGMLAALGAAGVTVMGLHQLSA